MTKDPNIFHKMGNSIINRLYLNDRKRLSPVLLGFVGVFSLSIFGSYVGLHLEDIKTAVVIIGVILAMRNVYQIFLRIPLAHFSQIVGRKPLVIAGLVFYTLALFFMAIANHWILVLVATTLIALGMSSFWPALIAYIGDVEKENIGELQGRTFQGTDFGSIIGSLVAFLLLRELQVQLQTLFAISSIISAIGAISMFFFVPEVLDKDERILTESKLKALAQSFKMMFSSLIKVSKQKKLMIIYVYQIILAFLEYFVTAFFPFLVTTSTALGGKGFEDETVALIMWISSGVLIFFKPLLGKLVDHFGFRLPVTSTILLSAGLLWVFLLVETLPLLIIFYIIYSASVLTSYISVNTGTTRSAKATQRGLAVGALGFYLSAGRSISTLALSPVWERLGIVSVFQLTSTIVIITTILLTAVSTFLIKKKQKN